MNVDEAKRRQSATRLVYTLFQAYPLTWIPWRDFAKIAPCSWRTRIAEARKLAKQDGAEVVWNRSVRGSAYMLKPYVSLGRDASQPVPQRTLFELR